MRRWTSNEGSALPLGVTLVPEEREYNFAIYSKHATGMTLRLYRHGDVVNAFHRFRLDPRIHKTGQVWHCRLPGDLVDSADYYGYQVEGPFAPERGHRFDQDKILLDPYARAVFFPPGFRREVGCHPGSNVGAAPLGVLHPDPEPFDWQADPRPEHGADAIFYEVHVKAFTQCPSSGAARENRGTYAGIIEKIPYLRELGVTVVELMPVFQYDPQEGNYWGYLPLSFFAPHQQYASSGDGSGAIQEFREMVRALHEGGIEVILDVVYDRTAEGNHEGPTYSFRGIDNTTYYLLEEDRRRYWNDTGWGNVLHTANPHVRKLILDSLRYWVTEMHVDGFRFDLASIFTRDTDGSINLDDPPIISAIRSDPDLAKVRLVTEAREPAVNQLERNFPGLTWFQWNHRFRDDLRRFVKGDPGRVGDLMRRIYGSDDLFPDNLEDAHHAYQSVNYITSHDDLTLYDLVSQDQRYDEANRHGGSDGSGATIPENCVWEGDRGVPPDLLALRRRQVKNFCCLLMLANGTPMFRAGDEFLATQGGTNEPYDQDNDISWLDWNRVDENREVFRFFKEMIAFRRAHPTLGRSRFWRDDVAWYGATGAPDFEGHELAFHLRGAWEGDVDLYAMANAHREDRVFEIQAPGPWWRLVDTAQPSPEDIASPGKEVPLAALTFPVRGQSVVVLVSDPRRGGR